MSGEAAVLEAKSAQREMAKRATFEGMKAKKPAEDEFDAMFDGEPASFLFRAIGGKAYDKLINECPATVEQMAQGDQYNEDKFAPSLLSRVCVEPELTLSQWTEIWTDPNWSRGERLNLFGKAVNLCLKGLDPGPFARG